MMRVKKIRAVGIVIHGDKILLIKRRQNKKNFWVFPGGSVEESETIEAAVIRELKEETSIKAKTIKLLYKHTYPDIQHEQYFYLCKHVSGKPKLGDFNEMDTMNNSDQLYIPLWIEIIMIKDLLLYPLEIKDWLLKDLKNDFADTPREQEIITKDLREEL